MFLFSDVNLNALKGGMARVVGASVFALMVAVVITLLAHVTVLQDGRYNKYRKSHDPSTICD